MKIFTRTLFTILSVLSCSAKTNAQQSLKSLLINHGATSCGSTSGEQQLFAATVSGNPVMLQSCNNGLGFYNVFTAYNPRDKKIYFADISQANTTSMYALDYNLSGVMGCAPAAAPDYVYNYRIDQLCFDANGDNLAVYNYDASSGLAHVKRIEVSTGIDIPGTDKALQFPAGNTPNSLSWGDIVFMPNGRVFMTFGSSPSKLYELINFDESSPDNATAVFLVDVPHPCYSIGYVDGNLIIGGSDGSGCYYFVYDISSDTLSPERVFPMGKTTADMTHMNVGVGVAQEFVGANIINSTTADIIFNIYLKNKGNIDLANVQLTNNLINAFGAGNISNVQVSFVSNAASLALNPTYDAVTDTLLLQPGMAVSNYPVAGDSVIIQLSFTASNLIPDHFYYSSATGSGQIGAGANLLQVMDSSNNGDAHYIDLDANGVSDDLGEGVPTPFVMSTLLAKNNLIFNAKVVAGKASLNWERADESDLKRYEVERSRDGLSFKIIAQVPVTKDANGRHNFTENPGAGTTDKWYYRLKLVNAKDKFYYSPVKFVSFEAAPSRVNIFPNPVVESVTVQVDAMATQQGTVTLLDNAGRKIRQWSPAISKGSNTVNLQQLGKLNPGIYLLQVTVDNQQTSVKLCKQ